VKTRSKLFEKHNFTRENMEVKNQYFSRVKMAWLRAWVARPCQNLQDLVVRPSAPMAWPCQPPYAWKIIFFVLLWSQMHSFKSQTTKPSWL